MVNTLEDEIGQSMERSEMANPELFVKSMKSQLKKDLQDRKCYIHSLTHLCVGYGRLFEDFENVSTQKVNSQGKKKVDPTVYLGTAGVSFALSRAI